MYCLKCEEDIDDAALLKHLRDYHLGEKDLQINCPACGAFYSNGGTFQKHWYSKHHAVLKRKRSSEPKADDSASSGSKKLCVGEKVSEKSASTDITVNLVQRLEEPDSTQITVDGDAASDIFVDQDVVNRTVDNAVVDKSGLQQQVQNVPSDSLEIVNLVDNNAYLSELPVEDQVGGPCQSDTASITSDTEHESDSDSQSDTESQDEGMCVDEVVKCLLPRPDLPSVNAEAASYLLTLNSTCTVPSTSIDIVITETEKMIKASVLNFASTVNDKLKDSNLSLDQVLNVNSVAESVSHVFDNIRTNKQQKKHFTEVLGVIEPKSIPLGNVLTKVRRKGQPGLKTVIKHEHVMFIPISDTLDKLMNHPDFEQLLQKGDSEFLNCFMKGEKCKINPVLMKHPNCFRFVLYYDDLEVCSPLKSKAGKHKLGAFYLLLDNIALKHRSNLSLIFLVALVNANYIKDKKYGMDAALEIIVAELQRFEAGVVLPSGKKVYGTLIAAIGDNLGSHAIGGFKEGFTANHCCRYCMATYEECQRMCTEDPKLMRTVESHDKQCAEIQTVRGKNEALSTKYGINRDSCLNRLSSYHVVGGLPGDLLHDMLEGCLSVAIKMLLNHFLQEKEKKFTLDWLNAAIQDFDFGYAEMSDKPSIIKAEHLSKDGSIHQSGCQIWLLAVMLPLIIGPLLQKDDKHFDNFLELLDISRIVFSTEISPWMIPYLRDLIESYLSDFYSLYGNFIPKQHYLTHAPSTIASLGAMPNYNCMRCEAKHKFFKRLVNVLECYKNIPLSLSTKHQLHMAHAWTRPLIKKATCGPCQLVNIDNSSYKRLFPGYVGNVIESNWLKHSGATFKPDNCFLCVGFHECMPIFVKLFKILIHPKVQFVCEKVLTIRRSRYYASYEIQVLESDLQIITVDSLAFHNILHAHRVKDALFIIMKYSGGGFVL